MKFLLGLGTIKQVVGVAEAEEEEVVEEEGGCIVAAGLEGAVETTGAIQMQDLSQELMAGTLKSIRLITFPLKSGM